MSLPSVSVVIPAYNAEAFVADAVASALAQTYPLNEIVCVDDGSSDGTLSVLRALEAAHPDRLIVLTGPNRGGSAARNVGMAVTTSEYLEFLDADDVLLPEKIERDVAIVRAERPPLLFGLHKGFQGFEDSQPHFRAHAFPPPPFDPWVCFLAHSFGHTSANLFRRDAIERAGGWDEARPFAQEYDLIARLLTDEPRAVAGDHWSTHVRRWPGSVSAEFTVEMREARIAIDASVLRHLRALGDRPEAEAEAEAALFLQLRRLYTLAPKRAVERHKRLFGTDYAPPANRSNTAAYRVAYRYLGFAWAEALKRTLDRVRTIVKR